MNCSYFLFETSQKRSNFIIPPDFKDIKKNFVLFKLRKHRWNCIKYLRPKRDPRILIKKYDISRLKHCCAMLCRPFHFKDFIRGQYVLYIEPGTRHLGSRSIRILLWFKHTVKVKGSDGEKYKSKIWYKWLDTFSRI